MTDNNKLNERLAESDLENVAGGKGPKKHENCLIHKVSPGETLSGIAYKYGRTVEQILEENSDRIKDPNNIRVGMIIYIPNYYK